MQLSQQSHARLPPAVNLYITYHCRSKCAHCFLVQSDKINKYELTRETLFSIIDQLAEQNVYLLIISGGEPLLHPDFFEVVRYADSRNILPLIAITGTKVTDGDISKYVAAGIPTVQLSLDGATRQLNDRIRGQGNFSDVISTARRFITAGVNVNFAICLHQGNFDELEQFFELCLELNVFRVKLAFYKQFVSDPHVREISSAQISAALNLARRFMRANGLSREWIASPTIDVWTGERILQRSGLPPLTIGADGFLTSGDGGPEIGALSTVPLAVQYGDYVEAKLRGFFDATWQAARDEYHVTEAIEEDALDANALIFKVDDRYVVYVKKALPRSVKFFSLLHEIGHIATRTLQISPRPNQRDEAELAANIWALNRIKNNLSPEAFPIYVQAAKKSETLLYREISQNLENDLIGYY